MKEFVKKKAVIVMDSAGLPNYMTMFYMEPGTYEPEDVPESGNGGVRHGRGKKSNIKGNAAAGV